MSEKPVKGDSLKVELEVSDDLLKSAGLILQSSRVITIIFTTETSTSDRISLGTDLF